MKKQEILECDFLTSTQLAMLSRLLEGIYEIKEKGIEPVRTDLSTRCFEVLRSPTEILGIPVQVDTSLAPGSAAVIVGVMT